MSSYLDLPAPGFSSFRELMEIYDRHCVIEEAKQKIHDLFNKNGLILFFKKGDELFGSPEDGRVTFARLKSGDEDDPMSGFKDEAKFLAINLMKSMFGNPEDSVENLFGSQDLPNIHVCGQDDAIDMLMKHKPKKEKNATVSKG